MRRMKVNAGRSVARVWFGDFPGVQLGKAEIFYSFLGVLVPVIDV